MPIDSESESSTGSASSREESSAASARVPNEGDASNAMDPEPAPIRDEDKSFRLRVVVGSDLGDEPDGTSPE